MIYLKEMDHTFQLAFYIFLVYTLKGFLYAIMSNYESCLQTMGRICRTGMKRAKACEYLQVEARKCCQYLGQEMTGSLSISVEGIGEGAEDSSTRATITKEREELRATVLKN